MKIIQLFLTAIPIALLSPCGSSANAQTPLPPVTTANTFKNTGRIANASCRASLLKNTQIIQGFVVTEGLSLVVVRAVGPTLRSFGLARALANPTLVIYDSQGTRVASGWPMKELSNTAKTIASDSFAKCGAFPLGGDTADAIFIDFLAPGAYTMVVSDGEGGEGDVLTEIYQHPQALFVDSYPQIKAP